MAKVNVTSTTIGEVSVFQPSIPFRASWPSKGSTRAIEEEIIEQLLYTPGFKYMIDTSMLYIEDMAAKKKLGIEPEDATEPVNVIVLSDADKNKYMKVYPLEKFKTEIKKLSREQIIDLADYAIENKITDFDKSEVIEKACGKNIIKGIQLAKQNKEG
jgi:predicted nucleotide-binding protein (sugar kinase/HSP70/actin superfamily)